MRESGYILIADDEETFLLSTADLLRREGYRCDCSGDAIAAAEMLRAAEYDLLIADIRMPGNPDLALIRALQSIAEDLPVILVTGYPSVDTAVSSIQLPVAAYLVKPLDFDELLTHVRKSIERVRVNRSFRSIKNRLDHWRVDMKDLENSLEGTTAHTSRPPIQTFIDLTLQNIGGALADLKHVTGAMVREDTVKEPCHLLNCPKLGTLTEVVAETIGVLEKTKSSFKSKELGTLRKKLERTV